MADLLVLTADTPHADPAVATTLPRRGDVAAVREDGWVWGASERESPWVILRVPGVSARDLMNLGAAGRARTGSGLLPTHRAFALDLDRLSAGTLDLAAVDAITVGRTPAPDPRHLGPDPTVLG